MTEPTPPAEAAQPPGNGLPNVQIQTFMAQMPGGRTLVKVDISYGPTVFSMMLEPATCAELGGLMQRALSEAAAAARRAGMGLIVADGSVPLPPMPNGGRP